MIKKPCINSSEWTYTGKEVSPTGLGYAPDGETEGTQMKGRDETMWIVGRKNGVKVWNRVPTMLVKEDPVMEYSTPEKKVPVKDTLVPPPAPKKVKKDFVEKIDPKDVMIHKDLLDRLNEVADDIPDAEPEPKTNVVPAKPEKKPRAPAKKKAEPTVPEAQQPAPAVPETQPPAKKTRAPAKKKVEEAKLADVMVDAPEPEKKKRAPAKKKETGDGEKKQTDYHIYLTHRLKTIEGATHKERFGAAAKEWGAMTPEQKVAAVVDLK